MRKNKGLYYILISILILGGGFGYQEFLYVIGSGYQMWDIISLVLFFVFSIIWFIVFLIQK